jgi:hypothetical protein
MAHDPYQHVPPERRLALRVPVHRRVRVAVGLRSFEAELLDLSITGCRLRCPQPVTAHGSLRLLLPAGFGGLLPMLVRGEVARAESVRGEPTGVCEVALRFQAQTTRVQERLCAALAELLRPPEPRGERRREGRRWFGRRVIAQGAGRPRVLLGRDLGAGGMSVSGAQGLAAGDELRIALHSQAGDVPLVLRARVLRCDERGEAAFAFLDPGEGERACLEKILASLLAPDAPVVAELLAAAP